jgi:hypothetical protein
MTQITVIYLALHPLISYSRQGKFILLSQL